MFQTIQDKCAMAHVPVPQSPRDVTPSLLRSLGLPEVVQCWDCGTPTPMAVLCEDWSGRLICASCVGWDIAR